MVTLNRDLLTGRRLPPPINDLDRAMRRFHAENPRVYELFIRFAFAAIRKGYRTFGVGAVWERLRWELYIETESNDGFKLNNNHRAYYARMFMRDYPEHAGFFKTRMVKEDR